MKDLETILEQTNAENENKVDWTKAWSGKYPILKNYQAQVDIPKFASALRGLLTEIQETYGYSEEDAMLVLKDILYHEYRDNKKK